MKMIEKTTVNMCVLATAIPISLRRGGGSEGAYMTTWTKEFRAQINHTSPPGAKLIAAHQQGKKVEAWWYTCRKLICRSFFFRIMIRVSVNSYTCTGN